MVSIKQITRGKTFFYILLFLLLLFLVYASFFVEYLLFKVIIGFAIVLIIKIKDLDQRLTPWQTKIFYFFVFIYPLIELFLKAFTQYGIINENMIQYQIYINIFEHIIAGMAVGMILFPFIVLIMEKLTLKEKFILFVPLVTFSCLLYELIGFYFFYQPMGYVSINQYLDSMRDLTCNIVGVVILFKFIIDS